VLLQRVGGDPLKDLFFHASSMQLFVIDHHDKSYLLIDQRTIDAVSALIQSLSGAVENQQGVLADMPGTLVLKTKMDPLPIIRNSRRSCRPCNW